ncbi:MAG: sulfatase-like hydrolase/transferase [Bacteroidota bacterium]
MNKIFYLYLLKLYFTALLILSLLRGAFFFYYYDEAMQNPGMDIFLCFLIGLIMDSNAISMSLLVSFLLSSPFKIFSEKYLRFFYLLFNTSIAIVFFTNLADIFYFKQYGTRMNALAMEVINHFDIVLPMLYKGFPLIKALVVFALLMYAFVWWHQKQMAKQLPRYEKPLLWFSATIVTFVGTSFLLYGMPLWYITSYSTSSLLNQMSSNGMYTFVKSFDQNRIYNHDLSIFPGITDSSAIKHIQTQSIHPSEFHDTLWWPTLRKHNKSIATQPKNIVFIIVETFSAINIGSLHGKPLSPRYDEWSKKGVSFSRCYANGSRTQQGLTSTLAGFPAVLGNSLIRRKGLNEFHSLGNILLDAGYETQFIHGGDMQYDDMDLFLTQGGIQQISDVNSFTSSHFKNNWGVCDEDLFDKAYPMIWSTPNQKPKFSVILTISNHAPFDLPPQFAESHPEVKRMKPEEATFYYTDYVMGNFLDKCAKHPEFKNTLFVIVADHGEVYEPKHLQYKMFHIPALLLNTSKPPQVFSRTCSQIDLAPTVLLESGYKGPYHFIGQNVFSNHFKPFAISRNTAEMLYMQNEKGQVLSCDMNTKKYYYHQIDSLSFIGGPIVLKGKEGKQLYSDFQHYLQGISVLYRNGLYQSTQRKDQ